ncbi:hypothetical protein AA313_de0204652 [Arthrobotrys entomopaga]|nr:hypothetical protein AA313_de0204652 [Arthrobotrys entomopaga]
MAPAISASFGAIIFMLIKGVVHFRRNPVPWAVWSAPMFFLISGTICTLSIVYKGSPKLGLNKKPAWYIASVCLGTGFGLAILSALFFVPYIHAKIVKKDYTLKPWMFIYGPLLFNRPAPTDAETAKVPDYAVVQKNEFDDTPLGSSPGSINEQQTNEKNLVTNEVRQLTYKELVQQADERMNARLRKKRGPIGWAMRTLHENPMGDGKLYEIANIKIFLKRLPAIIVAGALYGVNYDIHAAQTGVDGTPDGARMKRVYDNAAKYPNETEYTFSFIQVITACTASFAHGANDIGNAVGPWAVIYGAWSSGDAAQAKAPVPLWQIGVIAVVLCCGLVLYGFNIMRVMGNKITYHSPSRGCSMEMGAAITVLLFSQYSLPVSTSMCITGATVGVGLCNGTLKAVNFQRVTLLVISWIFTIPVAGTLAGVIMGIVLNAPHFAT